MKKLFIPVLLFCFCLSGCTGTKNVTDIELTLDLHYGTKTGMYTGTLIKNVPNGSGKFTTKNSEGEEWFYEGSFVDGHFSGKGKCEWSSGQIKEGTYKNDMMNGYGKLYRDDKLVYEGNWKEEQYDGTGKLYSSDGKKTYEGTFVSDLPEEKEFKEKCKNISYSELARQPESYVMKPISITGKIIQVIENKDGSVNYRVSEGDDYKSIFFVSYLRKEGEPRILESDTVEMWGLYNGLYSYESAIGGNVTVPSIDIKYLKIKE